MADTSLTQASNFKPYNLNIKHPTNILLVFSFFSPFIVIFFFTFMGMYFSPLTGIIFLITIITTIFLRMGLYNLSKRYFTNLSDNETTCNLINYSGIGSGDIYLSLWVFSFTLFYILVPLISNNGIQTSLMAFLVLFVVLFVGDIAIKIGNNCYSKGKKFINIFLNILFGGILGLFISLGYSMVDSLKPHLFFSKKSSNETCKQVNDTKFQCSFDFE